MRSYSPVHYAFIREKGNCVKKEHLQSMREKKNHGTSSLSICVPCSPSVNNMDSWEERLQKMFCKPNQEVVLTEL
jgi:hypothetical protein